MKRWYVVQVYTGFEEAVKADLCARVREAGAEDLFGDILVPAGRTAKAFAEGEDKREKIFPGYLLGQRNLSGDT